MKTCNACHQEKPLAEFYSKTAQCIPCKKTKDTGRRRYRDDRTGLSMTDAARARKRRWQAANIDARKSAARMAVRKAVRSGLLVRPSCCSDCGQEAVRLDGVTAIQAHHHAGYDKPLEVEWLCPKCHKQHDDAARATTQKDQP